MNSLFLIGNGFDKAHGLPTAYGDFINDFWKNLEQNFEDEKYQKLVLIHPNYHGLFNFYKPTENFEDFIINLNKFSGNYKIYHDKKNILLKDASNGNLVVFEFTNIFFKRINNRKMTRNWVDIENEYYKYLKEIVKSTSMDEVVQKRAVLKLNKEFEEIKKLLEIYLEEKVNNIYDFQDSMVNNYWKDFYKILEPISVFNKGDKFYEEFKSTRDIIELKELFRDQKKSEKVHAISFLLSFNYTVTPLKYFKKLDENAKINYIHGEISNVNNPLVFGFGDEMDEDYKLIENLDDNEYLSNFKSFKYLQTSYYDQLLSFINTNKYQVCILGHSCGLSDRVLLNTIFENENCRSIKVFYHQKESSDNYTDIIQNISRHFNDKAIMRSKIVNKSLSTPLPQSQITKLVK